MLNGEAIVVRQNFYFTRTSLRKQTTTELQRVAVGTNEFAKHGDVGSIDTDAAGIDRQAEALGEIQVHASVIQLRKAITLRGRNTIESRRIDRPGRTMTAPGTPRQIVKLPPIAFLPSGHHYVRA